jgi:hypothetical protein
VRGAFVCQHHLRHAALQLAQADVWDQAMATLRAVGKRFQIKYPRGGGITADCFASCGEDSTSVFTATRAHSAACRCRNACEERRSSIHIQHKDRQRHSRRHVPAPLSTASGLLAHAAPVLARIHSHEPGQRAREPTPTRPVEHYQVAVPAAVSLPLHPAL